MRKTHPRSQCIDKEKPRCWETTELQVPIGGIGSARNQCRENAFTRLLETPAQRIGDTEDLNGIRDSEYAGAHEIRHAQAIARYRAGEMTWEIQYNALFWPLSPLS
jgi:hypothetical protein